MRFRIRLLSRDDASVNMMPKVPLPISVNADSCSCSEAVLSCDPVGHAIGQRELVLTMSMCCDCVLI